MMAIPVPLLIGGLLIIFYIGFRRGKSSYERWLVREYNRSVKRTNREMAAYYAKNPPT